ncbi:MAG: hypothetical protein A3F44_04120 [Candidatus Doudnabacteria bacterium RIFCSPHIGHO2_12_FULL_47_25]|nr:MAG: hypothetical protein A3F44_04120 [Candidatus Doudnabacteria bacterium RIFCSPHIGHO2_12_FULL_47_25]
MARKFHARKFSGVEKINNLSAVHRIARKAIGVPRYDTINFTMFDTFQHLPENRSARNFGRLLFDKFLHDFQILLSGK